MSAALPPGSFVPSSGGDLQLSTMLVDTRSTQPAGPTRRQWLDDGRAHIDTRVDVVVGGQHLSSYLRVAELAAACAETVALAAGVSAGRAYLDGLHGSLPAARLVP